MSDKLEDRHTVMPTEENRVKLADLSTEIRAMMIGAGVVGVVMMVLPGNAEMLVHLDADWSAVGLDDRDDSLMMKPDTTDEQKSNSLNVLSILAQLCANGGEDFRGAFDAFAQHMGAAIEFDELVHTHKARKPH